MTQVIDTTEELVQDVAPRAVGRLFARQRSVADQRLRDGVVGGQLLDTPAADQVGAAVAQSCHVDLVVLLDGDHGGGAHAAAGGLGLPGTDDLLVRLVQGVAHGVLGVLVFCQPVLEQAWDNLGGHAAGPLAVVLASHAVSNEEKFAVGIGDEAVLVVGATALGAATADFDDVFRHDDSPGRRSKTKKSWAPRKVG